MNSWTCYSPILLHPLSMLHKWLLPKKLHFQEHFSSNFSPFWVIILLVSTNLANYGPKNVDLTKWCFWECFYIVFKPKTPMETFSHWKPSLAEEWNFKGEVGHFCTRFPKIPKGENVEKTTSKKLGNWKRGFHSIERSRNGAKSLYNGSRKQEAKRCKKLKSASLPIFMRTCEKFISLYKIK